jgi:hypothetical protein
LIVDSIFEGAQQVDPIELFASNTIYNESFELIDVSVVPIKNNICGASKLAVNEHKSLIMAFGRNELIKLIVAFGCNKLIEIIMAFGRNKLAELNMVFGCNKLI